MATPPCKGGAADSCATDDDASVYGTIPGARRDLKHTLLRCAGCGDSGAAPTIAPSDGVILVPVFGARADGGPALLCDACRRGRQG
jgi:hypothetical protein